MAYAPEQHPVKRYAQDALIPRPIALREIFRTTPVTAWRRERARTPFYPIPLKIGARVFYLQSEVDGYLNHLKSGARAVSANGYPLRGVAATSHKVTRANAIATAKKITQEPVKVAPRNRVNPALSASGARGAAATAKAKRAAAKKKKKANGKAATRRVTT